MKELKSYHEVWLTAHPNRDELWLRRQLADGFYIHHIDGNGANNDPSNLLLVEKADHMKLHGMDLYTNARRASGIRLPKPARKMKRPMSDVSRVRLPLVRRGRPLGRPHPLTQAEIDEHNAVLTRLGMPCLIEERKRVRAKRLKISDYQEEIVGADMGKPR